MYALLLFRLRRLLPRLLLCLLLRLLLPRPPRHVELLEEAALPRRALRGDGLLLRLALAPLALAVVARGRQPVGQPLARLVARSVA